MKFGSWIDVISVCKLILWNIEVRTELSTARTYLLQGGSISSLANGPCEFNSLANTLQRMGAILHVEVLLIQPRGFIIRHGLPCTRLHVGGVDGPHDGSNSP